MDLRIETLISLNRALWDLVTPDLRGVAFSVRPGKVEVRMLFAGQLGPEELEIISEVETYLAADFPPEVEVRVRGASVVPPNQRDLEPGEEWVFLRREAR